MTSIADPDDEQSAAASQIGLGVTVAGTRGHVLLGRDQDTIAVWQVSATGARSGAWTGALTDRAWARSALTLVERRAPAGLDRDADAAVLCALGETAGVSVPDPYLEHWVDLRHALDEVADVRRELAAAVDAYGASPTTGTPTPLSYALDLPSEPLPTDTSAALAALGLQLPLTEHRKPASADAHGKAMVLAGLLRWWSDTETSRVRRTYLRPHGGPTPRPLPPRWLSHLQAVFTAAFDL
jgi:hypothetical protein